MHCIAQNFTALHCTILQFNAQHCTALYCTASHWTALHCTALHCTALYRSAHNNQVLDYIVSPRGHLGKTFGCYSLLGGDSRTRAGTVAGLQVKLIGSS